MSITKLELVEKMADKIRNRTMNMKSIDDREAEVNEVIVTMCHLIASEDISFVGEVPASGANGAITEMATKFRVQYRCGYGRNNYAPCIEILK
jgi:hypothetical protein